MRNEKGQFLKGQSSSPATQFKRGEHWRPPAPFREKEYLLREYIGEQRSTGEIAAEHGVTDGAVLFWLYRHEIPRRRISEARKIKHWGVSGEKNPMFGKRGAESGNWKGGHTPERQACYCSLEWLAAVKAVWQRDKGVCQRCAASGKGVVLHIHHLVPFAVTSLRCEPTNLMLLCRDCHIWIHSNENTDKEYIREEGKNHE